MSDWIDDFIQETEPIRSPEIYRRWGGISCISALLERKVWSVTDIGKLHPNTYIMLVGAPAAGKTNVVRECRKILATVPGLKLAPDNPTKASFLDSLAEAEVINGLDKHHALAVQCREFGVLFPKYDEAFLADMSDFYDAESMYSSPRRTSKSLKIEYPIVNMIACATPSVLNELPPSMWKQGFSSRTMFIYGTRVKTRRNMFKRRIDEELKDLRSRAAEIYSECRGELAWDEDAQDLTNDWINNEMPPIPAHGRLKEYIGRRESHFMKLSMISSVSAGHGMTVTKGDCVRAKEWLLEAESFMADGFMAMTQKSDSQLLEDLHRYVHSIYSTVQRDKRKPVPESTVHSWLAERVPSERIIPIIKTAQSTNSLRYDPLTRGWIPIPKEESGSLSGSSGSLALATIAEKLRSKS